VTMFRWLGVSLLLRKHGFDTRSVYVGFMLGRGALKRGFLQFLAFNLSVSFHQMFHDYITSNTARFI